MEEGICLYNIVRSVHITSSKYDRFGNKILESTYINSYLMPDRQSFTHQEHLPRALLTEKDASILMKELSTKYEIKGKLRTLYVGIYYGGN